MRLNYSRFPSSLPRLLTSIPTRRTQTRSFGIVTQRKMASHATVEHEAHALKFKAQTLNNAQSALKAAGIIPDVLDDFTPTCRLQVLYTREHREVLLGNDITPDETQDAPVVTVTSPGANPADTSRYIIVMTDPDAPSREDPKWSEFCHWIAKVPPGAVLQSELSEVAEVKHRSALENKRVKSEDEIIEYMGPAPPPKTGKHRYVLVLLHGDASKLKAPKERKTWGTDKPRHGLRQWAEESGLKVVGANFYYAQNKEQ